MRTPALLLALALPALAGDAFDPAKPVRYVLVEGECVVGFDGKSTLDDFTGSTRAVSGELRFAPRTLDKEASGEIRIDATKLDTKEPERDKLMHGTHLETAKHPAIVWTMDGASDLKLSEDGRKGTFLMKGILDLHGVRNRLEIPVEAEIGADGALHAKGAVWFRMTSFKVAPPVKFLVIRVSDSVKVWFEIRAKPAA